MDDIIVPELQNVDTTLIIDPDTRTIDAGSDFLLGVETDNDAERVKFQCPKIVGDNLDLSQYHIYIHYQNAKGEKGKYLCEDIEDGGENITFSWLLSQKAVLYKGQTKFLVCAKKTQEDTIVWNTTLANGNVLEGLDVDEDIVQQNDDVIEQILLKLEQIEASGGTGDINNAKVTFTEAEERTNIKSQETMSTMFGKIKKWFTDLKTVAFSGSYNDLSDKPTIPSEYTLPIATPTTLGGVKPVAKTDEMTQEVGVDELGGLFTKEGNVDETWKVLNFNITEPVATVSIDIPNAKRVFMISHIRLNDAENSLTTGGKQYMVKVNGYNASFPTGYLRTSGGYLNIHEIEKIDTFIKVMTTNTLGNGNAWSASESIKLCGWANTYDDRSETINNIEFSQYENGYLFMENCTWRIYYK